MRTRHLLAGIALAALLWAPGPSDSRAEGPTLKDLQKQLKSGDHRERLAALESLDGFAGDARAEKSVIEMLRDHDWGVQIRAARTLGEMGGDAARKALANQSMNGEIQWVRDAAVEALRKLDPKGAVTRLTDVARATRHDEKKARALQAAGPLAGKDDLLKFRVFLKNKDVRVAEAAARAIAGLGVHEETRPEVIKTLKGVLKRRDEKKHFFAYAAAIEALGTADVPEVRKLLVDELLLQPNDDGYVPERIARGLERMQPEGVSEAIRAGIAKATKPQQLRALAFLAARVNAERTWQDMEKLLTHKDERVRSNAARALGVFGAPESAPALRKLLDTDKSPYVRVEVVTALARTMQMADFHDLYPVIKKDKKSQVRVQFVVELADMGHPEGIGPLSKMLGDKSWRVASAAAASIGTLGVAEDLPHLQPLLKHKDWRIRAAAYEGLGRLRAENAVPLLAEGLDDRDPVVIGVCHANLQILTQQKFKPDAGVWSEWWTKYGGGLNIEKQSRKSEAELAAEKRANERYVFKREEAVEVLQKARIIVVIGAWDKAQVVLDHLRIKHTLLRAQQLKEAGLNPNQIVLVNCEGNMDKDTRMRVQWFVNVGGYLMTTDWALTKTVMPCFPGYMTQFSGSSTGNDVVVVEEALPGHPLTSGVFDYVPALKWWHEIQAFPMTVLYPERCDVLVDSAEMKQRYGSSPMASVFRWGLGKVQHSISHFFLQEEGMQSARSGRDRMIFAADNLGLSLEQIREMATMGSFTGALNPQVMEEIAPDYSMFRLIVNMVREKSDWVENL